MSWSIDEKTITRMTTIMTDPQYTLVDLLNEDAIKTAVKRQIPRIIDYFMKNAGLLVDIAFGVCEVPFIIQRRACELLISGFQPFQSQLQYNSDFLQHIYQFVAQETDFTENNGTCFTKIMEHYIKVTDCQILNKLPNRNNFLPAMLKKLHHLCIMNLIEIITCDPRKSMWTYLQSVHAELAMFNAFGDVDYLNERILNYMRNIVCSADNGSPALDMFTDRKYTARFFNLGYNATPRVAAAAFRVIYEVLGLVIYEEEGERETNILYDTIFKETAENLEALCEFATQEDKPFLEDNFRAIELIIAILTVYPEPEECVYEMMEKLFDEFFKYPNHTFLHESFYNLFLKVSKGCSNFNAFVERLGMREKIMERFEEKDMKLTCYCGHLYQMSNIIVKKLGKDPKNEKWNKFYETTIEPMKKIISEPFGGLLPKQAFFDSDDDDEDITPRDAAYKIFGKSFFLGEEEDDDDPDEEEEESVDDENDN